MIRRFFTNDKGVTMVEYGLIIACISLVVVVGFGTATEALTFLWGDNNSRLIEGLSVNQTPQ